MIEIQGEKTRGGGIHQADALAYSIRYGDRDTSSSVSDVGRYVIILKLGAPVFNTLPVFTLRWETAKCFLPFKFRYTKRDVIRVLQQMHFK
jgi:hypothetical protein